MLCFISGNRASCLLPHHRRSGRQQQGRSVCPTAETQSLATRQTAELVLVLQSSDNESNQLRDTEGRGGEGVRTAHTGAAAEGLPRQNRELETGR